MTETTLWTNVTNPTNSKERNLLASERRAHAARISHQRRRAARQAAAKRLPHVKVEDAFQFVDVNGQLISSNVTQHDDLIDVECPTVILTYSKEDEDAIRRMLKDSTKYHDDESGSDHSDGSDVSDQSLSPPVLTHMPDVISTVFDEPYQKQSFQIWTTVLSQRTASYGFYCRDIFLRVIPQLCMNSPALRHMVLAHSLAHQHRRANLCAIKTNLLPTRALYHYTKGLEEMCHVKTQANDFLAAICMASLVEAGQNNHSGTMKHVKGYEEVFQNYQGEHDETYHTLRSCYYVIKIFGELMALGRLPDHQPGPWTVETARESMKKILHSMEDRSSMADPQILLQHKVALGQWFNAERDWNRTYNASINREATLLLLQLAISLMPQYGAGDLSSDVEPRQIIYLLSGANDFLEQRHNLDRGEQKQLYETLELLAISVVKNIKDLECRRRAMDMLQEIIVLTERLEQ